MQVTLERGGGLAGGSNHQRLGPAATEAADDGTGGRIEQLVADADFFELDGDFPRTRGRSDPTWHSIRVVNGDADRTVRWDDNQEIPEALRQLWNLTSSLGEWHSAK